MFRLLGCMLGVLRVLLMLSNSSVRLYEESEAIMSRLLDIWRGFGNWKRQSGQVQDRDHWGPNGAALTHAEEDRVESRKD